MSKRVLFVDDEPRVLEGLENMLFSWGDEWECDFVNSGAEALDCLEDGDYDILVTDMRMPVMSGDQLLARVHTEYPNVIRVALSGYAEMKSLQRALPLTHQFFTKPCKDGDIRDGLERIFRVREVMEDPSLRGMMCTLGQLPVRPTAYLEIIRLLSAQDTPIAKIGELIEEDAVIAARVVQFANASAVARSSPCRSVRDAVVRLGGKLVKGLLLAIEVPEETHPGMRFRDPFDASMDAFHRHSYLTAKVAVAIAPPHLAADAFLPALLHDVGTMVLAGSGDDRWYEAHRIARATSQPMWRAESAVLGVSHAEVGACLLATWGFADHVIEAVANHHQPARSGNVGFDLAGLLHVACALAQGHSDELDTAYLESRAQLQHLPEWQEIADQVRRAHAQRR